MLKPESTPTTLNQTAYTGFLASCISQLGEPISEGATARVYLIYSEGSFYIIKKIQSRFLDKFRKEVGILRVLQRSAASPFIVQYLADLETDKGCFILFPYIHGMTLHKWLAEGRSDHEIASMKSLVGLALKAIHAQGVVHGDVKANNIWVPTDGYPFLFDFGESGAPGAAVTIARSGFGDRRGVNALVLSPNFNFQKLELAFAPPLVLQAAAPPAPLDALTARIKQIINRLHTPPSAGSDPIKAAAAAVAAEAAAHGFIPRALHVLASEQEGGGYRKKSRSRAKKHRKTKKIDRRQRRNSRRNRNRNQK